MLIILEFIVNTLKNSLTLQGQVADRIFPTGVDIEPEKSVFPLITFHTVSEITRTVPKGARDSVYQIDIWSVLSQLQIETIAEIVIGLLNFTQFHGGYGSTVLRWQREDSGSDLYEADRRIWHKSLRFRTWVK